MSFEGEAGVDEGGLSASLYQSYFGQLFAAPALCESHEEGLPLPAPGAENPSGIYLFANGRPDQTKYEPV